MGLDRRPRCCSSNGSARVARRFRPFLRHRPGGIQTRSRTAADHADPGPRRHLPSGCFSGVPTGVIAALNRNSFIDRALTGIVSVLLAMPGFWLRVCCWFFFLRRADAMAARGRLHAAFSRPLAVAEGLHPGLAWHLVSVPPPTSPGTRAPRCWHSSTRNMPAP